MKQYCTISDIARANRLCRTTIWRYRRRYPDFPKPIVVGATQRWIADEVDAWFLQFRGDE